MNISLFHIKTLFLIQKNLLINKYNEIEKSFNSTINALKVYGEELNYLNMKTIKIVKNILF